MKFEFATAPRIVFGPGTVAGLGAIAREFGSHALLVGGATSARIERLARALAEAGVRSTPFAIAHEPTTDDAARGVLAARAAGCELVISCGGGSVIDGGKAIAALVRNDGPIEDYLEVIGRAQPLRAAPLPFIAIPTTAGTGAEVTRNGVLSSPTHRVKVSLRSPLMLPKVALVDPELTYDLSPALTAATGCDALTQLIEPFVSVKANPITDALCRDGIARAARSLRRAVENGADGAAREDMCVASLFGGMALANAGLGAVHGLAGPIGGAFPAPHGAVCAALLPHVTAVNLRALRGRGGTPALRRYAEVARLLTGEATAAPEAVVDWLGELVESLAIPRLAAYGIGRGDFAGLIAAAQKASSMKGNPLPLTDAECAEILTAAL